MKISYNWLQTYLNNDTLKPAAVSEILTGTGLEVEALDLFSTVKGGLEGLVIGKIIELKKHPNADRLSLALVDTGVGAPLNIVCGAKNIAPGLKVVVAPVGAFVHPVQKEAFEIVKSKIRGEWSEGMICAEDEISLGASHEGVMILPEEAPVGDSLADYLKLETDWVFEIGITPNRSDALSHRGTARDVRAFLRMPASDIAEAKDDSEWWKAVGKGQGLQEGISVSIENEACTRFSGISISGVEVKESPDWLRARLLAIGLRPINNIVDITNFLCHDLGQPMHAYDRSKIKGGKIRVRTFPEATPFTTLDGQERNLQASDLMISDEERPLGIAGIFGGLESGITDQTRDIFLEAACFDAFAIRKTARRHGLKTDASFRFERGTDPTLTLEALAKASRLVLELAGGNISSDVEDHYPRPMQPARVLLRRAKLDSLIGQHIPDLDVNLILQGLGIQILEQTDLHWHLEIPLFKTDVRREVDVIEELLRVYGFNLVQTPTHLRSSLPFSFKSNAEHIQEATANWLSSRGFQEIVTNSLSSSAFMGHKGPELAENAIHVLNPLSLDLDILRQSLLYSGLKVVAYNRNRKQQDLKLYEYGTVYKLLDREYVERKQLGLFMCGQFLPESWAEKSNKLNIYHLKGHVQALLQRLNVTAKQESSGDKGWLANSLSWKSGGAELVVAGSVDKRLLDMFEIDSEVFYAEFEWNELLSFRDNREMLSKEVPRFPSVRRDLSLLVPRNVEFEQLKSAALSAGIDILNDVRVFDVYTGDKIESSRKSYAMSFILENRDHTLTDVEIEEAMNKLIKHLEQSASAFVRK